MPARTKVQCETRCSISQRTDVENHTAKEIPSAKTFSLLFLDESLALHVTNVRPLVVPSLSKLSYQLLRTASCCVGSLMKLKCKSLLPKTHPIFFSELCGVCSVGPCPLHEASAKAHFLVLAPFRNGCFRSDQVVVKGAHILSRE